MAAYPEPNADRRFDFSRVDSQLSQLGREPFGPALLSVCTLAFFLGLRRSSGVGLCGVSSSALRRSSTARSSPIGSNFPCLSYHRSQGAVSFQKEPVPDPELDSQGLDRVMPSLVGFEPPISGPFESIYLELARFHDNDRVVTAVDGLFVDPKLSLKGSSVSLCSTVSGCVLDNDRGRDVFLPENVGPAIVSVEIGRNTRHIKPIGAIAPCSGGSVSRQ